MATVLLAVGCVSSGFLVGVTIGRSWSLAILPLVISGFLFLADPMQVVVHAPLMVLLCGAALGGTWSGLTMHRSVQRQLAR